MSKLAEVNVTKLVEGIRNDLTGENLGVRDFGVGERLFVEGPRVLLTISLDIPANKSLGYVIITADMLSDYRKVEYGHVEDVEVPRYAIESGVTHDHISRARTVDLGPQGIALGEELLRRLLPSDKGRNFPVGLTMPNST